MFYSICLFWHATGVGVKQNDILNLSFLFQDENEADVFKEYINNYDKISISLIYRSFGINGNKNITEFNVKKINNYGNTASYLHHLGKDEQNYSTFSVTNNKTNYGQYKRELKFGELSVYTELYPKSFVRSFLEGLSSKMLNLKKNNLSDFGTKITLDGFISFYN